MSNNLGTVEQGKKVYQNILIKLDKNAKLTGFRMKEVDFYNLRKYMLKVTDNNRILRKTVMERYISFTLRNVPPASTTADYREVTVNLKNRDL